MSVSWPSRSLFSRCAASRAPTLIAASHGFHSSAPLAKRKTRFKNVKAEEMGLLKPDRMKKYREENFPDYSKDDLNNLKGKYTPEQIEAIEAAETTIATEDIAMQGRLRDDRNRPKYFDDLTILDPRYDVRPMTDEIPKKVTWKDRSEWMDDYGMRMVDKTDKKANDQLTRAMVRAFKSVKADKGGSLISLTNEELDMLENNPSLMQRFLQKPDEQESSAGASKSESMTQTQALQLDEAINEAWQRELINISKGERNTELELTSIDMIEDEPDGAAQLNTAEAPELGKIPGVAGLYRKNTEEADQGQEAGEWESLKELTGLDLKTLFTLNVKILHIRHVHNQTRLGKIRSVSVQAMCGNGNGLIGIGFGKSSEAYGVLGERTARIQAIRNVKPIRRYENRTIYGTVIGKVGATTVELSSRPPGTLDLSFPVFVIT